MVYKRKKYHYGDTHLKKKWRTKRRTKDLDEIDEDLKPENCQKLLNQPVDFDKPGSGQHYCIHCARHFISDSALQDHFRTKVHKRRLKALELEPYTVEDSERAAGLGEKAQTNCAVLTPEIDFETQITNKNELISNVKARNLNVNVENIIKQWELFKDMKDRKIALENTRTDLAKRLAKKLITNDIEKHELHLKLVKDDLKNLKEVFYDVEESTMLNILNLPNTLHSKTPLQQEHILFEYLEKPTKFARNHIEIATEMNLCKYLDPFTCYLKSDAALCELKLLNYFREYLLGLGYVQFSNTNFCRSVVLEGCDEIQHDNKKVFALESSLNDERINKLHLCGSATLFSFMAYFTKHLVHHTLFPLKYFSIGKMYRNSGEGEASFFNLYQQSALNVFMADTENSVENVDDLVRLVRNVYDGLNVHYRIVILPANKIEKPESLRLSVQMYSNFEKTYIEVGNVSFYNSYVSKRLLFTYTFEKRWKYPSIISGSLLNFHKFLGCLFENIDKDLLKDYFAKING